MLGLDVNASAGTYRVERVEPTADEDADRAAHRGRERPEWMPAAMPDPSRYGIRLSLADVKGISDDEVARVVAGQPYRSLADFWNRASVSRPVVERLVLAGGFDSLYGFGVRDREAGRPGPPPQQVTRRDLLLQIGELDRWSRSGARAAASRAAQADLMGLEAGGRTTRSRGCRGRREGAGAAGLEGSGLPEFTDAELVRAELEVLGLDASRHVIDFYRPFLAALGAVPAGELLAAAAARRCWWPGSRWPPRPRRSGPGRRVVFVTLDDGTGCTDSTFFEDVQGPYAATVFHSWLLVVRGVMRRTGPRGVSMRATGAWELPALHEAWEAGGLGRGRRADGRTGGVHRAGDRRGGGVPRPAAGGGPAGAGAPDRFPDVALRRHQAGR